MTIWLPRDFHGVTELEVKRSRFITDLARVDDEDAARAVIAGVKAQYPDARHHCTAFIVDVPDAQAIERSSDDGEPAGTAGMPMLEVLRGSGVSNVVAVVTRYFGGVLLGTGGLVRAYSDAVSSALDEAPRVRPVVHELVAFDVGPDEAGRIQGALMNRGIDVVDAAWGRVVRLTLSVADAAATAPLVREIVQRDVTLEPVGQTITESPI